MCGLFGYAGLQTVDPTSLRHVGELAGTRGPHSHGWATVDDYSWTTYRAPGPITDELDYLESVQTRCIVGHSRLATTGLYAGGAPRIEDTMPFRVGEVAVVHNGNVRDYVRIAREWRIDLNTGCDSEVIAHILDRHRAMGNDLYGAVVRTIQAIDDGRPFALIAITSEGEIAGAHRELPLYVANADEGTYFCSRRPMIDGATVVMSPPVWAWPIPEAKQDVA